MMTLLNIILTISVCVMWGLIFGLYKKNQLIRWLSNKFIPDKPIPKDIIKNGFFSDGTPIPFRENLYEPHEKAAKETAPQDHKKGEE